MFGKFVVPSIGWLQSIFGGFSGKTYIVLTANNGADQLALRPLNKRDSNLQIISVRGNDHGIINFVGPDLIFSEIKHIINGTKEKMILTEESVL